MVYPNEYSMRVDIYLHTISPILSPFDRHYLNTHVDLRWQISNVNRLTMLPVFSPSISLISPSTFPMSINSTASANLLVVAKARLPPKGLHSIKLHVNHSAPRQAPHLCHIGLGAYCSLSRRSRTASSLYFSDGRAIRRQCSSRKRRTLSLLLPWSRSEDVSIPYLRGAIHSLYR